jgi:hypothetical protein
MSDLPIAIPLGQAKGCAHSVFNFVPVRQPPATPDEAVAPGNSTTHDDLEILDLEQRWNIE